MGSWSRGGVAVLSVGCHPNLPPQCGPGSWGSGRCCRGMRLARERRWAKGGGGWLRAPVLGGRGELQHRLGPKPLGPLVTLLVGGPSSGCKTEAQDLFEHLLGAQLGLAGLRAELTGGGEARSSR